jgi:hypothetical protein
VTSRNFGVREASVTSEVRRQEWVSIATSWGSRSGDRLRKPGQRLGGRKTDGGAAGGLGDDDGAGSERDRTRVDPRLTGFEMG